MMGFSVGKNLPRPGLSQLGKLCFISRAFHADDPAPDRRKGRAHFKKRSDGSDCPARQKGRIVAECQQIRRVVFESLLEDPDRFQFQAAHDMTQEAAAFSSRLHQGHTDVRTEYFYGQGREPGAAADIDQPGIGAGVEMRQKGQRVEEVGFDNL